jgi:phosphoglycerate dehydrogenase-like enzyme
VARVLVTSLSAESPTDPVFEPLLRDGHELVFADTIAVRSVPVLIEALDGMAATIASTEPYNATVLSQAPDLRVISRSGVGYDAIDVAEATRRGIAVCVTPGANHHSVADMAVGLIIACARRVLFADRWVRSGRWTPLPMGVELRGSTVGVVGTGRIGCEVVKRLWGFEPLIVACDVVQSPECMERYGVQYVPLDDLLERSDFVTLHAPLLPETRALINAASLARMKPTAYLVNTARGPLVDEAALVEALRAGRIAGAALDVFESEPLPADSPLRTLDNLILLPHVAGVTAQSRLAMARMAVENAARALRGEPPLACLNPEVLNAPIAR